ncbi:GntR family transcriptional regulator [Paracoccus sp. KR1-242]|uniref:GntR family transcriptional regulator n=1 Tax=Paracoccus sp. KR1-242 TaxID=3410028 RepID=UPI003C2C1454
MTVTARKSSQPSAKQLLSQQIADRIRQAIVDADFEFGESLSEEILAQAFDVSRTPVREALNLLQVEGLVIIVPKSGTFVYSPSEEGISDLVTFRGVLETSALRLLPRDALPGLSARLQAACARMERAMGEGDMRDYGRADTDFHLEIVQTAGNRHLVEAYRMILGRVASLRTHLALKAEGEPRRSFRDHRELALGILDAEGPRRDELAGLLEGHIHRTRENYLNAFRQTHLSPGRRMRSRLKLDR